MTSHGSPAGFFIRNGASITPKLLDSILDRTCGDRPTVVLVSACFSGIFVNKTMQKPNRIILTAAREDRTSFGCSAENEYTYWDGCLIDSLPASESWKSLYGNIQQCVKRKESHGRFTPSLPQAYFGQQVSDLRIPKRVTSGSNLFSGRRPLASGDAYGFTAPKRVQQTNPFSRRPKRVERAVTPQPGKP
jgi:hypothetical protein